MAIPNARRFRISNPDTGQEATIVAVLPKGTDIPTYLKEASGRFDWKGYAEAQQRQFKIRVGQQKQRRAK
jgi:hypothetical protein